MWKTFAEMGFCGLLVPEEFGGSGLGHVEAGIVAEEIGHTLLPSPFLASAVLTVSAIAARRQQCAEVRVPTEGRARRAAWCACDR
jgi:alkylation response protein AidB-like acyl-CoA dehydrogenase